MDEPLKGKRILIPRSKKQAASLVRKVEDYGGIAIEIPLLAFKNVAIPLDVQRKCIEKPYYKWLVFTSSNGVRAFFQQLPNLRQKTMKVAAIGEKTTNALREYGISVDFMPSKYVAETFAQEFLPVLKINDKVLIVKGNLARDYLYTTLKTTQSQIEEIIVYQTYFPQESEELLSKKLKANKLDVLIFTSASTVDHFMFVIDKYKLHRQLKDCTIVSIGPVTRDRLRYYQLEADVMPDDYTVESMIKSLGSYFKMK
ncbi:uroporphyrinogen-III synthase [Niallia sp. NCCP-28]|uniref:uroporphyrinogen-III synthase n=1 Tax=Niallia sp. NCCP-28 TaxID=2934712 RepID=UPI002084EC7F|nr:uroporphyrinogen-III synthase [Niallia sp. NCCP-28]GKU81463.1 uroporphyrinogen-III synthase [Niallia sp. NCCP-28]